MLKMYGSARSRAVRTLWMAMELNIPYEHLDYNPRSPETRTPEFLALNPNGSVPVIDDDGFVWISNGAESTSATTITKLNPDGTAVAGSPFKASGLRSPQGMAIDSVGNVWAANQFSDGVVELKPNGQPAARSPYRAKSLLGSWGLAIDGKDRVWVGGFGRPSIMELCGRQVSACPPGSKTGSLISPAKGFTSAAMQRFTAVAIDSSGNVWGAHNYSSSEPIRDFVGGNGLYEIIGAAAPVKTPMLGAVKQP